MSGTVMNAQGKPIAGATVEALNAVEASLSLDMSKMFQRVGEPDDVTAFAKSGDDGKYELILPGKGSYSFRAFSPKHGQEIEPARAVVKDITGVDFHLFNAAIVSGIVVASDDTPIAGARVMLADPMSMFRGGAKTEGVTDATGRFSLPANATSAETNAILVARAVGYAAHVKGDITVPSNNVRIQLETGVTLRMRTVVKGSEKPAVGVRVAVMFGGGFGTGTSDAAGEVVVAHLPTKSATGMGRQKMAILTADRYVPQMKNLASMKVEDGLLDAGKVEMEAGGVVRGMVKNRDTQKPVAAAMVRAMGGLEGQLSFFGGNTVLTNEKGEYELYGVPLKASSVAALHKDYVPELNINPMAFMGRRGGGGGPSMFPPGETEITKEVLLTPGEKVIGVVVDGKGDPVAGAQIMEMPDMGGMGMGMIRMMMLGGPPKTHSNADGTFALGPFERDKEISLAVSHRDYGPAAPTKATPGSGESVRIALTEPLTVTGKVVDEQGEPVQGVRVNIEREEQAGGNPMRRQMAQMMGQSGGTKPGVTDVNGVFTVRNAPLGQVKVQYEHDGYMEKTESMTLAPAKGEKKLPDATLERGLGISGMVVDEHGEPVPDVTFSAWSQDARQTPGGNNGGRTYFNGTSDAEGKFEQWGLADGTYKINIYSDEVYAEPLDARTGQTDVRIVIFKGGTLRGRVIAGGTRVADADVRATFPGQPGRWMSGGNSRTDSEGMFELSGLPPKPFTLRIDHDEYIELVVENVEAGDGVREFRLEAGRVITGKVVDQNGRAVGGANVSVDVPIEPAADESTAELSRRLARGRGDREATTAPNGTFRIAGIASQGELEITVDESGKGLIRTTVKIAPGQNTVNLVAEIGESISGVVQKADGTPVGFVNINASDGEGGHGHTWVRGGDGKFEIRGLKKGKYTLTASRWRDGKSTDVSLQEIPTGTTDVVLKFNE